MISIKSSRSLVADRKVAEAVARLDIGYLEPTELQSRLATSGVHPLAIISFGHALPRTFSCPVIALDLPQIDGPPLVEVWTSDQRVQTQEVAGCSVAMNGDFLVGSISLNEKPAVSLDVTTYAAYREMVSQLRDLGYPYLWRAWNYFPCINADQEGLERYRRFCVGRHLALTETLSDYPFSLPAGTAVGTRSGPLQVVFLAGTQPATHLGNPRQLNAYEYPRNYGPCSPSFARATFARSESGCLLFLAGTASIVGHMSRHVGLPNEQTRETIRNVRAVLTHAKHVAGLDFTNARHRAVFKVYVRDYDSLPEIRRVIEKSLLTGDQILFLQSDLCRKELLVEIEGLILSE